MNSPTGYVSWDIGLLLSLDSKGKISSSWVLSCQLSGWNLIISSSASQAFRLGLELTGAALLGLHLPTTDLGLLRLQTQVGQVLIINLFKYACVCVCVTMCTHMRVYTHTLF